MVNFSFSRAGLCLALSLLGATSLLSLGGCASVTARQVAGGPETKPKKLPAVIYVNDFSAPAENLRVDRSGDKLAAFQKRLADQLSAALVKQIDHSIAPSKVYSGPGLPPRSDAWLIVGRFDQVNQGSRALRSLFGFGLGGTKVVTTALVYDLSTQHPTQLLAIQTSGGSNASPGTVINVVPVLLPIAVLGPAALGYGGILIGAAPGAIPGLGADEKRTAREIAAMLSDYCYRQGFISKKQAMKPKSPGYGAIRFGDPKRPGKTDTSTPKTSPTPAPAKTHL